MSQQQRIEVLAIGDELLDGRVVDTNSVRLAHALAPVGLQVAQRTLITDDLDAIVREAQAICARGTTLCVVSGGLGPTADDMTAEGLAKLAGVGLVRDPGEVVRITEKIAARGREVTANQLRQADRPEGATLLQNPVGTAPGFSLVVQGCRFVSLPGVPYEFDTLVKSAIVAPLIAQGGMQPRPRRGLYLFGLPEAEADRRVADLKQRWPQVRLQFRVKFPEVHVTLHADLEHEAALDEAFAFASEALGIYVYAHSDQGFAATVLGMLRSRGESLALAESCTGGLITDLLTDVPGSSDVLHAGITAYANAAKKKFLGVQDHTLASAGAVSEAAVREMAQGARSLVPSTYGLAVSGIAGPGGGSAHKPVGTIWFGLATPTGVMSEQLVLPYNRRDNKVMGAFHSLDLLRRHLLGQNS